MAGTRPEMAWPHVEQNAVVAEISLPHFEQYTVFSFLCVSPNRALIAEILLPSFSVGQSPVAPKISPTPTSLTLQRGLAYARQHV